MIINIGTKAFSNQNEATVYYRGIRDRIALNGDKANTYFEAVDALFRKHPRYSERVSGKAVLRYGVLHGKFKTPCLCVVYEDGTVEDFSFYKCIRSAAHS